MIHPERRRENIKKIEEMDKREKVIKAYEDFVNGYECFCTSDDYEYEMHKVVLALLKEQDNEAKRIMKVIWDTLHEGFSIDTIADQDWVYEQIRHRIEDI